VLFNETWRQPLFKGNSAPSILILGGEQFGDHFELEGSIKISRSRYLHLQTNLWLSNFQINYGQNSSAFNQEPGLRFITLPIIPKSPLTITETEPSEFVFGDSLFDGDVLSHGGNDANTDINDAQEMERDDTYSIDFGASFDLDQTPGETNQFDSLTSVETSPYIVSETITLQQKRRMRSSELHYIDHPRVGLLIKITPYEGPLIETNQIDSEEKSGNTD